tara:strand:+ start:217 stop:426 length:210 start_codon:yes stop_codon:yes gene_type:complete
MKENIQDDIFKILDEKIDGLKLVLDETIEKHSDAAFDLKDLKQALEDLEKKKNNVLSDSMLVMAPEDKK